MNHNALFCRLLPWGWWLCLDASLVSVLFPLYSPCVCSNLWGQCHTGSQSGGFLVLQCPHALLSSAHSIRPVPPSPQTHHKLSHKFKKCAERLNTVCYWILFLIILICARDRSTYSWISAFRASCYKAALWRKKLPLHSTSAVFMPIHFSVYFAIRRCRLYRVKSTTLNSQIHCLTDLLPLQYISSVILQYNSILQPILWVFFVFYLLRSLPHIQSCCSSSLQKQPVAFKISSIAQYGRMCFFWQSELCVCVCACVSLHLRTC